MQSTMRFRSHPLDLLALFPAFDSEAFGGVQTSGGEAWRSIAGRGGTRADAFYYHPATPKMLALMRAIRRRTCADTLLVWHFDLLKLAPIIETSGTRVVLFLHGIEAWRKQSPLTHWVMKRTRLFLSNSDFTWQRFASIHPAYADAPHRTVHLGTGEPLGRPRPAPSDTPAVLMIGRLRKTEDYKGHREMIQAWPQVLARVPEAELWIVGDGDLRPELEHLSRTLGLGGRVTFYGQIPDARKETLLERCRILALPSKGEGFGLVYLEAMRMGRPCLVSNFDAGREVVNPPEAGLAVDPDNPAEIADAIQRLLRPGSEWEQWSARARCRYEHQFTAEHFQQRLVTALFGS